MANSASQDYETMIQGLKTYRASLEENCTTLLNAVITYDEGINDSSSHVYRKKVTGLCQQINPRLIERVAKLQQNLEQQLEQIYEMERQLQAEENE